MVKRRLVWNPYRHRNEITWSLDQTMKIEVGMYGIATSFSTIVEDAFDSFADVTYLRGAEEIETFVSDRTFPNTKILVVTSQSLAGFKNLWPLLKVSLAVPTFHLVTLK